MENLGFYLEKETSTKKYYKRIINYSTPIFNIVGTTEIIIQNKSNGNIFVKKIVRYQNGKKQQEPFCITKDLLNFIVKIPKI